MAKMMIYDWILLLDSCSSKIIDLDTFRFSAISFKKIKILRDGLHDVIQIYPVSMHTNEHSLFLPSSRYMKDLIQLVKNNFVSFSQYLNTHQMWAHSAIVKRSKMGTPDCSSIMPSLKGLPSSCEPIFSMHPVSPVPSNNEMIFETEIFLSFNVKS